MDPAAITGLADQVALIYSDAELQLITMIAERLERGLDAPDWALQQLIEVNRLGVEARGLLRQLAPEVAAAIQDAITQAQAIGIAGADADIRALTGGGVVTASAAGTVDTAAIAALAGETLTAVTGTHSGILRSVDDIYRQVVADVTGRTVTGVATRREITQQALNKFAAQGLTGFRDKAGRNWKLDTYAEMATRTSTLRAMKQGHTDRLVQRGYDMVRVSAHPAPAPQCHPFEGKILSLTGRTENGPQTVENARTGQPMTVTVTASMAEAESQGLHHPHCRHRHHLLVPGATEPAAPPYDPQDYKDEQKLRYLERQVRAAKREQAAAITPAAKKDANARVRARQAAIRDHVDTTGVTRRTHREQLRNGDASKAVDSQGFIRVDPPKVSTPHIETPEQRLVRHQSELDTVTAKLAKLEPDKLLSPRMVDTHAERMVLAEKVRRLKAGEPVDVEFDNVARFGQDYLKYSADAKAITDKKSAAYKSAKKEADYYRDRILEDRRWAFDTENSHWLEEARLDHQMPDAERALAKATDYTSDDYLEAQSRVLALRYERRRIDAEKESRRNPDPSPYEHQARQYLDLIADEDASATALNMYRSKLPRMYEVMRAADRGNDPLPGLARKANPVDSHVPDVTAANPHFADDLEYQINCQRVAQTMELRRRGYEVTAKPNPDAKATGRGDLSDRDIADLWGDPATGLSRKFAPQESRASLEAAMLEWGEGARGWITCNWKAGSAHIFNAEVKGGKVIYYDGQPGKMDVSNYFEQMKTVDGNLVRGLLRVDDQVPRDAVRDLVNEKERP